MELVARRLRIEGRVQGVGYRAWTVERALALGLKGYVRNRRDGTVEALVLGAPGQVEALIAACRSGPHGARVTEVLQSDMAIADAAAEAGAGFRQRPTV